jgi:hypothetical protein
VYVTEVLFFDKIGFYLTHFRGWLSKAQHLNKSIESQRNGFLGLIKGMALLFTLIGVRSVPAYTPEAETILEALSLKIAAGEVGQTSYAQFFAELGQEDGCAIWAQAPPYPDEAIWKEILEACPELIHDTPPTKHNRSRGSISQGIEPRKAETNAPLISGAAQSSLGGLNFSLREFQLYNRLIEFHGNGVTGLAGNLQNNQKPTRIHFISGKNFYTGWSGNSGFTGPLASTQASLDGLGIGYNIHGWQIEASNTWNRLEPSGNSKLFPRRDALLYLMGLSHGPLRLQMAQQRFESATNAPASVSLVGATVADAMGRWQAGWGGSHWDWKWKRNAADSHDFALGTYGEFAFGSPGIFRLKARQASLGWANPLQSFPSYRRDTLAGEWILPGHGEGGLDAWSHLEVYNSGIYQIYLDDGQEISWTVETGELLVAEARIAVVLAMKDWSYTYGTGKNFRSSPSQDIPSTSELRSTGIGHIFTVEKFGWKARLSLIQQAPSYRGPYPEPLALSFEPSMKTKYGTKIRTDIFTGDFMDPAQYLRLKFSQIWDFGKGYKIRQSVKLPWSRKTGWDDDLMVQVKLEASLW